ncbi:hypothetical protein K435DRAFT_794450 [Dendrothele bispora CBS 962.96]|uniref:Uncharacterized protein n=1 Tax=Dendrothele bispora (strain CBS 962.96) TaxID=1314807 RepID=A0A4S8MCD3_DENBC|nr:hypothetical protein K435DRAFT_794450 [Dendrothele bispora CBS 962.96]
MCLSAIVGMQGALTSFTSEPTLLHLLLQVRDETTHPLALEHPETLLENKFQDGYEGLRSQTVLSVCLDRKEFEVTPVWTCRAYLRNAQRTLDRHRNIPGTTAKEEEEEEETHRKSSRRTLGNAAALPQRYVIDVVIGVREPSRSRVEKQEGLN